VENTAIPLAKSELKAKVSVENSVEIDKQLSRYPLGFLRVEIVGTVGHIVSFLLSIVCRCIMRFSWQLARFGIEYL
jgi:hypothetical protein